MIYLEVGQSLRKLERRGSITAELADDSLRNLIQLRLDTHRHPALLALAWSYRHELTIYDGSYLALAELMDADLVTGDAALASVATRVLGADRVLHLAT